jgi:hypothetical protein
MSYLVFCTFDLKGASSADYQNSPERRKAARSAAFKP